MRTHDIGASSDSHHWNHYIGSPRDIKEEERRKKSARRQQEINQSSNFKRKIMRSLHDFTLRACCLLFFCIVFKLIILSVMRLPVGYRSLEHLRPGHDVKLHPS